MFFVFIITRLISIFILLVFYMFEIAQEYPDGVFILQ